MAGLCNAIHLSKFGKKVLLIEKNEYPKHKVCGEYISNEVLPYLEFLDINPFDFGAVKIDNFQLSTTNNKLISAKLPLGGFGISRYQLDFILSEKAIENGVLILQDAVINVNFENDFFTVETKENQVFNQNLYWCFWQTFFVRCKIRSRFYQKKIALFRCKNSCKRNFQIDLVALHNFKGGYCGVSKVENNALICVISLIFHPLKSIKILKIFKKK